MASEPSGSSTTTGRFFTPSVERMAICGWLITRAVLGAELVLLSATDLLNALVVDLYDYQRVGRRGLRPHHVLGRDLADAAEGHDLVALAGARRLWGRGTGGGSRRRGGRRRGLR